MRLNAIAAALSHLARSSTNKQAIPYVYGHAHKRDAEITKSMTSPHWQKLFDVVDHSDKKECKD